MFIYANAVRYMLPQIVLQDENSLQTVEEYSKTTDLKGK